MQNIEIVKLKIEELNPVTMYEKKVHMEMTERYLVTRRDELKTLPKSKIIGHDFKFEMEQRAKIMQKEGILTAKVIKLERHKYSPEQNKLHLSNGKTLPTPYRTTISDAVTYWVRYSK